ncbi:hypothetical protein ACP4OV_018383 [Aristida adscensionis]
MSYASVVRWWEEWQLRILALGSLGVQCFLAFFGARRKDPIRSWFRFFIWLSYLGSDALAIYALATLFNRQREREYSSVNCLEVLWVPILLMHLGGQVIISAYNIEDNELWRRHLVTALSQVGPVWHSSRSRKSMDSWSCSYPAPEIHGSEAVNGLRVTVALYVFSKSWPSSADKRLLAAAILLFVTGILRCFEKPLALKRASFCDLVSSPRPTLRTANVNKEVELEQYIQEARDYVKQPDPIVPNSPKEVPKKLFLDYAYTYSKRLGHLKYFWSLDDKRAYKLLSRGHSVIFDLFYTRGFTQDTDEIRNVNPLHQFVYGFTWFFAALSTIAIALFHRTNKEAYIGTDVKITYVLMYVTYILDAFSMSELGRLKWHNMVAQHSLIWFFARNKRHSWVIKIVTSLKCMDFVDQYWCMKPCSSSEDITKLVRGHVKDAWTYHISDIESYRNFSDARGHLTLKFDQCEQVLRDSLEKPFDESILLWHMATDFCFHRDAQSANSEGATICRQISNYMMHLLFASPDMLMPGSRRSLFTKAAYEEIEEILKGEDIPITVFTDERELTLKIIEKAGSKQGFVQDAWELAQGLTKLGEGKMWDVIKGVWVEMLCFSAGRCRGFLHAKSLGYGGEYLSYVWLLMACAGLETFPESQQRIQLRLPKEERVNIATERNRPMVTASVDTTRNLADVV